MGEVYRARDTQLGRDVALKLLPPAFAADPDRLARFERESRVLASLNHPNIAAIHSIEHVDDLHLLVLELVDGPTLADRLKEGPVPVPEALAIARQLTEGLEAAHACGIVHRDLKPANVKLAASGRVALLDFGLAKERAPASAAGATATDAAGHSSAGLILGTCAYMSPEQARGQPVDARTDIWAFGCILFELLSGERAFRGDTPSDTLAAVLERQPDWSRLPHGLHPSADRLLRRCLQKDPQRRLRDIADARIEVDEALTSQSPSPPASPPRTRRRAVRIAAGVALTAGCVALGWWARDAVMTRTSAPRATRFAWALPPAMRLESPPAVSPDGQHIAFTATEDGGLPRLYVRPLSGLVDATPIPRTEGAAHPFWSPDSQTVAYFARGKLMKVAPAGGSPVEICAAGNPRGGSWGANGVIVFSPGSIYSGLSRVSAGGGPVEKITLLDTGQGENSHRWPAFLPDGVHFLYFVRSVVAERRGVYIGRIDRPASTPGPALFRSESEAVYARLDDGDRGVLLSVEGGQMTAQPFDWRRRVITGDPSVIGLPAGGNTPHHASTISLGAGVLAHVSSPIPYGQPLASSTRTGEDQRFHTKRGIVSWPRVSPDGGRIVSQQVDPITGSPDLWVDDLERGARLRVTREGSSGQLPVWSADGAKLAYLAGAFQDPLLTIAAADGTGVISTLQCPRFRCEPSDWSRDGRWLLVTALENDGRDSDVWMLPVAADDKPRALLTEPYVERDARFSPGGDLVAYVSGEIGHSEISVRTVEGTPPRRAVVSVSGGTQPVWSHDGKELYFVDLAGLLQNAAIRRSPDGRLVVTGVSRVAVRPIGTGHYGTQYDLSPDGGRVYFLDRELGEAPREIGIVLDWRALLK